MNPGPGWIARARAVAARPPGQREGEIAGPGRARGLGAMNLARAGLGVLHLAAPGFGGRLLGREPFGPTGRAVVRVLGVRQLTQAGLSWVKPSAAVLVLGFEVDTAHWLSMLALASISRRWRRPAAFDAAVAAAFAGAGLAQARSAGVAPPAAAGPPTRLGRLWALRDRLARDLEAWVVPPRLVEYVGGARSGGHPGPTW